MLTYNLSKNSPDPLYLALYKCIRNDIRAGVLSSGFRLPSKRTFAQNLGISVLTVENAYAMLADEGYIFSVPKKGYYVSDLSVMPQKNATVPAVSGNSGMSSLNKAGIEEVRKSDLVADFCSAETDPDDFPFKSWSRILRKLLNEKRLSLLSKIPTGGVISLRQAIAQHLRDFHGMKVDPMQIVIGAGTEYLLGQIISLLGFNLVYASEDPCYRRTDAIYKNFNVHSVKIAVDDHGLSYKSLSESPASVVHISPSHQFPTGVVMPVSRRYELLSWVSAKDNRYIIEDDYDSEFRLQGRPLSTLQSIDAEGRVIYMNTFTKTLSSSIRVAYMVLPSSLLSRFYERFAGYSSTVPSFEQYTLAEFIQRGDFELHINRLRRLNEEKRELLLKLIDKSTLKGICEIKNAHTGLHFLLKLNTGFSDEEGIRRALANGVKLSALSQYSEKILDEYKGWFLISYASVPKDHLEKAVRALEKAFT